MSTLNHFLQRGKPKKGQLNIIDIFNINDTLLQRGFENVIEGTLDETLINTDANTVFKTTDDDFFSAAQLKPKEFIDKFKDKSFRLRIRNMVYGVEKNVTQEEYVFESSFININRYTKTVELLIAYLCVNDLQALSASFGVKIKNAPDGGDFDCIANFQNSLFHFEIKSGDIKNLNERNLQSFLNRHIFLAPDASVLFLDYQSGNKGELDKLILKFKDLKVGAIKKVTQINKIQDGSKKFYTLDGSIVVIDLHNNEDILSNLRSAMQYFHRYNAHSKTMNYLLIEPSWLGYDAITLD